MTAPEIDVRYFGGAEPEFALSGVTIGKGFHWERKETQRFRGELKITRGDDGMLTAINIVPLEEYLKSVISSEMSATSSSRLLKAHAVISRSWLLSQIYRDMRYDGESVTEPVQIREEGEIVRWYDREDHSGFDVCADDHCQRYQGVTRQTSSAVAKAVEETRGEILSYEGRICDARFSKCCGGVMEEFGTCWEPARHPYLQALRDVEAETEDIPDLRNHEEARHWITSRPASFCNTSDPNLLGQVLNSYDREDTSFYRWQVVYTQEELDELVARKSGIGFGRITAIEPLERGKSGRVVRLRIVGSIREVIVGKELEIRRWLSPSHLKSSAFVVDRDEMGNWIFKGAGWGHGVGLCQIGAAAMAAQGYDYRTILGHYFPGATLTRCY